MNDDPKSWDVFICHASEDKDGFVRPLAVALDSLGVSVWYDEFSLRLGDSLSRSIDKGLASSKFGLAVISQHFLQKPWPEYELRGLVAREIEEDRVILPIWHGVTRRHVLEFSPPLADKVALKTEGLSAQDVAIQIFGPTTAGARTNSLWCCFSSLARRDGSDTEGTRRNTRGIGRIPLSLLRCATFFAN